MTRRQRRLVRLLLVYSACGLVLLWVVFPLVYISLASLQPERNLISVPLRVRWSDFSLESYGEAIRNGAVTGGMANSAIVAAVTTALVLAIGLAAAYPLARGKVQYRWWSYSLLSAQTVPVITLVIPVFLLMRSLGALDNLQALSLVYTAFLLPFAIWILRTFLADIPLPLEHAARIDGCTRFQAFRHVLMPIAAPGIAATAIFVFISSWNEFILALVLTRSHQTVTVRLSQMQSSLYQGLSIPAVAAATVIAVAPIMLVVVALHRIVLRGLAATGVRG